MGFWIVWAIGFAVITGLAANARGRDPMVWALIGAAFGIFGLIAVLVMENLKGKQP